MKILRYLLATILLTTGICEAGSEHCKKKSPSSPRSDIVYPKNACAVLKNPENLGFGAVFFSLLKILDDFDKGKCAGFLVNLDSGCYLDPELGPNWWEYLFEPLELGKFGAKKNVLSRWDTLKAVRIGYRLSKNRVAELIQKYIQLKPEIRQEIDLYVHDNFDGFYVIGVHHRGTDKKTEAPLIPYTKTFEVLENQIAALSLELQLKTRIFIATDDSEFLAIAKEKYQEMVIYNDFVRSSNENPLHYSEHLYSSNYQKFKEAVLDCFLLSRCDFLIFPSASSFSLLSSRLNSNLPSVGILFD